MKLTAFISIVACLLTASLQAAEKPNIVFVLVDDHALEAVSAYGSHLKNYAKTPAIDRLAEEGMRFDNFVCANSLCSPSRASFITGQYSHVNGVKNLNGKIKKTSPWLSEELQKGGYETLLVGKWHLKGDVRGFDNGTVGNIVNRMGDFHLRGGKRTMNEAGTRVTLIARWPGRIPTGKRESMITVMDMLPTLASVAGIPVEHEVDGMDLSHNLFGLPGKDREVFAMAFEGGCYFVRDKDFRLHEDGRAIACSLLGAC